MNPILVFIVTWQIFFFGFTLMGKIYDGIVDRRFRRKYNGKGGVSLRDTFGL